MYILKSMFIEAIFSNIPNVVASISQAGNKIVMSEISKTLLIIYSLYIILCLQM